MQGALSDEGALFIYINHPIYNAYAFDNRAFPS